MPNARKSFHAAARSWEQERNGFFESVKSNDVAAVRAVGEKYPECASWNNGMTPLEIAMKHGAADSFDALLALNPDVNNHPRGGRYPLHHAIAWNRPDFAEKLIDAGARIDAVNFRFCKLHYGEYFNAMAVAIEKNDGAAVALLIDKGADVWQACVSPQKKWDSIPVQISAIDYAKKLKRRALVDLMRSKNARAAAVASGGQPSQASGNAGECIAVLKPLRLTGAAKAPQV
jgi:ankyrin repeat protein